MSEPMRKSTYDASEIFWNSETGQMREALLLACGYDFYNALDFSKIQWHELTEWAQTAVVRLIGNKLIGRTDS